MRLLLRGLGFVLLAAAFAALVIDGSRSIAGGRVLLFPLGEEAAWLAGPRFAAGLSALAGWPASAQRLVAGLLDVPGSVALALAGLLLLYGGRPRPAPRFSSRRT